MMRLLRVALGALVVFAAPLTAQQLTMSSQGYLEARGLNVLVFSNWYNDLFDDSKISGIELIHHGNRTATNGDVRMTPTPGQWDDIGKMLENGRTVDTAGRAIVTRLRYDKYDFDYTIRVEAAPAGQQGARISVILDKPLPAALVGKAGLNLEFIPSQYMRSTYMADGRSGLFGAYPTGPMRRKPEGGRDNPHVWEIARGVDSPAEPLPMATARTLVLAPENPERRVTIASDVDVKLYDGRNQAQNGWFVVRSEIPAGKTGAVISWTLTASTLPNWTRAPMIAHSQVGYVPTQKKVAVIELDPNDTPAARAKLLRIDANGAATTALEADLAVWPNRYLRYAYRQFDFSSVTAPGLYAVEYNGIRSDAFRIAPDVYASAWHASLDVFFPVQMDHMLVNEAYRVWHGDSHRDDAVQAPTDTTHYDLYRQGPTTDTRFKPYEHIPGLNVGGWYDAGDYDIRTQTIYATVRSLVDAREEFGIDRDETTVDQTRRFVDIHVPDGQPDILQQIEHGARWLLSHHTAVGFAINGVMEADLSTYHHLGDAVTKTDGLIYDPSLGVLERRGDRSGRRDDRWAFTNRSTPLNYGSAAGMAAAARVLRGYNDSLATALLTTAQRVWDEEHTHAPFLFRHGNTTGGDLTSEELGAAIELLLATRDRKYQARIDEIWTGLGPRAPFFVSQLARLIPIVPEYRAKLEPLARQYATQTANGSRANPFGVNITAGGWAGNGGVVGGGNTAYVLHKYFPDLVDGSGVFRATDYLFGTHPGHNLSFVSGVGLRSKEVAYGSNRADFSYIAGGVVPGVLILRPDFPENREDWPFFWGENEYVVNVGASFIYLANAANRLANQR